MASSSHSEEPRLYEVFISFAGKDTRSSFVPYLHSALEERGIRTFLDTQNIDYCQSIADELPKAIEETSIAIVVLSENFGWSTWCLRELDKIMECKITHRLDVFPIFYNIYPSTVRHQEGSFSKALLEHEKNFKDDAAMVKNWRKALKDVADITGEVTRGKNELSCIKNIADKIFRKLPVKASQFRESVKGIESRVSEIIKFMYSKPNEVVFIGLWGMGGVGKTTTARAIFEDCKNEFEGSCFLEDVKRSNNELEKLQEKLLSNLCKLEVKVPDVVTGSSIIQNRLQFKRVLIVIDDVDDIGQLNALAKQCEWFARGSVIIITTRDDHLLKHNDIKKYDVKILLESEALHLFCFHAFKDECPPEDYIDLSLRVLRYAGGLPLALKVLGEHLNQREIPFWESTLSRLKDLPEKEIISKLQISFDGLNVLQQNIFLNIACFFRGSKKYEVKERLQCLGLHPEEGIDVLVQKSLVYIHGKDYLIETHELLQEMGRHIVRQRANSDISEYSRLWLENDIVAVLSNIKVSSDVELICMGLHVSSDQGHDILSRLDQNAAFRKMNNLRFLELCGKHFKGKGKRKRKYGDSLIGHLFVSFFWIHDVFVPQSSGDLYSNKLRWFSLSYYKGQFIPKSFRPMNLVHLSLQDSEIEGTPDFSYMPNLEELNLCRSARLVHVHPSLGDHMKIKRVHLEDCEKVEEFPKMDKMKSLEILNLKNTNLKFFPEICGNLNSLRKLDVRETSINGLPTSIVGNAPGLLKLKLDHQRSSVVDNAGFLQKLKLACGRLYNGELITTSGQCHCSSSLEVVQGSFPGLVSLEITGSSIVRTLDFSHLPHLEKLDLSGSDELAEIHASLGAHKRIKSINLKNCSKLVEFPIISDMNSLEELDLSFTSLKSFPEMRGNVNRLVKLRLDSTEITTLPWSIERATGLGVISMIGCDYLLTLPISFLGLQLQKVSIANGPLTSFTDETGQAVEPHSSQRKSGKEPQVTEGRENLSALHINFECCRRLEKLPEPLLAKVASLTIKECQSLTSWICYNLVDLLDNNQHLCNLQLHQRYDKPHDFLQASSLEWESLSNMLRKREESFRVYAPGSQIPSWIQHRINIHSATAILPPLDEWYNVKGLVLSGINAGFTTDDYIYSFHGCGCQPQLHVLIMYIPINNIREWERQNEFYMFELPTFELEETEEISGWGLSLVYSEGEYQPYDVQIQEDDNVDWHDARLIVKIGAAHHA